MTDTTGTISERYAYDAYGKVTVLDGGGTVLGTSAYGNRYTYTGREWDGELGLYHYRARMYSPETGRFVSRDPIGYVDNATSLYAAYFAFKATMDPAGTDWVYPWDSNAEWWWPFDEIPDGAVLDGIAKVMDTVCPLVQSDKTGCLCCVSSLVDWSTGFFSSIAGAEIPYVDSVMNGLDCICDEIDMMNTLCSAWNWSNITLNTALAVQALSTFSCMINIVDIAVESANFDRVLLPIETMILAGKASLMNTYGCDPCPCRNLF